MIVSSTAAFTMMPGMAAYAASKAGVEQFANCLRLEVAHKGVAVGSVHPGWIDTDLVRDQRKDLKSFDDAIERFPWPLNATTSVEECADAIVAGIERRRSRVYVPRAIAPCRRCARSRPARSATWRSGARRRRWCRRWRPRCRRSAATSGPRAWRCRACDRRGAAQAAGLMATRTSRPPPGTARA